MYAHNERGRDVFQRFNNTVGGESGNLEPLADRFNALMMKTVGFSVVSENII